MINYIFQVLAFHGVFILFYAAFLKNKTFFNSNRVYLILTAILAYLLPFIAQIFQVELQGLALAQVERLPEVFLGLPAKNQQYQLADVRYLLGWPFWLATIYASGFLICGYRFVQKLIEVNRFFRFRRKADTNMITLTNSDAAFSFWNTLFIGDRLDAKARKQIIRHERIHIEQRHGVDLFLFELLRIVFWFDPSLFFYQRAVIEVHEFLADREVASNAPRAYYNCLLNTAFDTQNIAFVNTFFDRSLIKKRILMLHKHSKKSALLKYVLILPLLAGMFIYVGCSVDNQIFEDQTSPSIEEQIADLKAMVEAKEELTDVEKERLMDLMNVTIVKGKSPMTKIQEQISFNGNTDVLFSVIDEAPVYLGCEGLPDNESRRKCMTEKITKVVQENFKTELGEQLGLSGVNKIYVKFRINANGHVTDIASRGPNEALETEAIRVIEAIPDMKPGKQRGKEVGVLYSLPIVFQVEQSFKNPEK